MDRSDRSPRPESQFTPTSDDDRVFTVVDDVPALDEVAEVVDGDIIVDGHEVASNPLVVVVRTPVRSQPTLLNCAKKRKGDVLSATVHPHRSYPRPNAKAATIEFFAALIRERGALPPEYAIECNVLPDGSLELVDGAHRVEAARRVGLPHLPCRKVSLTELESLRRIAILNNAHNPLNLLERGRLVWADQRAQNAEGEGKSIAEWAKIWGVDASNVYACCYAAEVLSAEKRDVDWAFWATRTAHLAAFRNVDRARWAELVELCERNKWKVTEARAAAKGGPDSVPARKGRPTKPITPWGQPIPLVSGTRQRLWMPSGRILIELCPLGKDGVVHVRVLDPKEVDSSASGEGATSTADVAVASVEGVDVTVASVEEVDVTVTSVEEVDVTVASGEAVEVAEVVAAASLAVGSQSAETSQGSSGTQGADDAESTTQKLVLRSRAELETFQQRLHPKLLGLLTKLLGTRAPTDPVLLGGELDGNRDSFQFVAPVCEKRFRSQLLKGKKGLASLGLHESNGYAVLPKRAGTALLAVFGTQKKVTYVAIGYYDETGKPPTQFFGALGGTVVGHAVADVRAGGEYGSLRFFACGEPNSGQ